MFGRGWLTRQICRRRGHRWGEWTEGLTPAVEVRYCGRRRCAASELRGGPAVRKALQQFAFALRSIDEQIRACAAEIGRGCARGGPVPRPAMRAIPVQVVTVPLAPSVARGVREAAEFQDVMDRTARVIRESAESPRATFPLRGASS